MEFSKSKVYIKLDAQNRIIQCEGGYTESNIDNIENWIQIDEGYGDKYNLCQTHYFEKSLYTDENLYRYKYINNEIIERTAEELAAETITQEPTQLDRIEAQVMYTALMTDSLIEEDV